MFRIVLFAVLLFSVSANTERVYLSADGYKAPYFEVSAGEGGFSRNLADLRGSYVLLNFWAAKDAPSRLQTMEYTRSLSKITSEERFCFLSVNFDRSERLFREIVRRDNLNAETQFHAQGEEASKIIDAYRLDNGFQSFLIDPQGKIVATNPDPETVARIVAEG